ncbi:MAG: fused MFS/spermidine synthase [Patulibacter sp.]
MARRRSPRSAGSATPVRVESTLGVLELVPDPDRRAGRVLLIDGHIHGYVDLDDPSHLELDYVARIGGALEVLAPRGAAADVLHLGGGAFSLPRFLASTRPQVRQTVVERSAAVIKLAEKHLRLKRGERLRVVCGDGRVTVERSDDERYDLVIGDAFVGVETPTGMATADFAAEVRRTLRPDGAYLLNVIDQPPWPVVATQVAHLRDAFGHVVGFAGREVARRKHAGNMLLLASDAPLPLDALHRRLAGGAHPAEVLSGEQLVAAYG